MPKFNVGDRVSYGKSGNQICFGVVVDWKNPFIPLGITPGPGLFPLSGTLKEDIMNGEMVLIYPDNRFADNGYGYSPFYAMPVDKLTLVSKEKEMSKIKKSDKYCSCSSPQLISNVADGKKFFYCRSCKKEST